MSDRPFDRCYWVDPGRLLAGAYPHPAAALQGSVTFVVDLTEEGELEPYTVTGVRSVRLPVRDFSVPTEAEMTRILDAIDEALAHEEVVYVHCWGGRGRTGTVVGCHLVRHGLDPAAALRRIEELRRDQPNGSPSPETPEQRAMVLGWRAGL